MLASILAGRQYRQERQTVGLLMLPRILAGRQYRQERQTFGQTDTRHALRLGSLFIYIWMLLYVCICRAVWQCVWKCVCFCLWSICISNMTLIRTLDTHTPWHTESHTLIHWWYMFQAKRISHNTCTGTNAIWKET